MKTKLDGVRWAHQAVGEYKDQIGQFEVELRETDASLADLRRQLEELRLELATRLLPIARPEDCHRIETQLGVPGFTHARDQLQRSVHSGAVRLQELSTDPEVLDGTAALAALDARIADLDGKERSLTQARARFEFEEFEALRVSGYADRIQRSGFQNFWNSVTLASRTEQRNAQEVLDRLGIPFETAYPEFQSLCREHDENRKLRRHLRNHRLQLSKRVEEFEALQLQVRNPLAYTTHEMRKRLAAQVDAIEFARFPVSFDDVQRKLISRSHGLKKKIEYLESMHTHLENEVRDRKKRVRSIDRVRQKWRKNPFDRLVGDKHKWLVTVPAMKAKSTRKRNQWTRSMRRGVTRYDDWDTFDRNYWHAEPMLAYDLFYRDADEAMPHEGFAREIVPEILEFRNHSNPADTMEHDSSDALECSPETSSVEFTDDSEADLACFPDSGDAGAEEAAALSLAEHLACESDDELADVS